MICINVYAYKSIGNIYVWMYKQMNVQTCKCVIVDLCGKVNVWLYECTYVRMNETMNVWMFKWMNE